MAELLIEFFSEEIPARMQAQAAADLKRLVTEKLAAAGLSFTSAVAHSTPRRLALAVDGLPVKQADVKEEKKGPRVGSPEKAVEGFLKSAGLDSLDQCEQRDTGKGVFYFAVTEKKGGATVDVLGDIIVSAMDALPWPKSMRWADTVKSWVRPLHSIIALFDGQVIKGGYEVGGVRVGTVPFGDSTRGHRFLAPDSFSVTGFADYQAKLEKAYVLLDRDARKAKIKAGAEALCAAEGLTLSPDDGLLEEVAGLAEWPLPLMGSIDDKFMDVPAEVLITSMRTHQKYFAALDKDGKMAARFVVVANMITADGGKAVVAGNERVLRARLSDAKFFWDLDRKTKLDDRLPALEDITFHAKLGTVAEKVDRMAVLAGVIAEAVGANAAAAKRAATLAKADLVSGVVGEFPEVQGIMGRYYALGQGEAAEVADAIANHYKPVGPSDTCPNQPVSVSVALADKLDTLVGFFAIDEKPTGSKDPYALRRAALGVIRLIVENKLRVKLSDFIGKARESLEDIPVARRLANKKATRLTGLAAADVVTADLLGFFADRLKVALKDKGVRHDLVDAVFALGGEDDLVRLLARVDALAGFVGSEDGGNLLAAYKRASNILRIEEKKDGKSYDQPVNAGLFAATEEMALSAALTAARAATDPLLAAEDFAGAMAALAGLRGPVDAFFEKVTVNAEDAGVRANRLALLSAIRATLNAVADFSRIEG
jgi:glycyl-tRNA synthetase beta chain